MSVKQLFWIIGAAVAVAAVATGICYFLCHVLEKKSDERYIECECEPECT